MVPTVVQVENKWKTLVSVFKKAVNNTNKSGNETRRPPYYEEMGEIMGGSANVTPLANQSSSGNRDTAKENSEKTRGNTYLLQSLHLKTYLYGLKKMRRRRESERIED